MNGWEPVPQKVELRGRNSPPVTNCLRMVWSRTSVLEGVRGRTPHCGGLNGSAWAQFPKWHRTDSTNFSLWNTFSAFGEMPSCEWAGGSGAWMHPPELGARNRCVGTCDGKIQVMGCLGGRDCVGAAPPPQRCL